MKKLKLSILTAAALAFGAVLAFPPGSSLARAGFEKLSASAFADQAAQVQKELDPAAWGTTHAGKPVPEFVHGDECLFCHRNDIGPGWQKNAHGLTLRQQEDAPALAQILKTKPALAAISPQVEYFLGSRGEGL